MDKQQEKKDKGIKKSGMSKSAIVLSAVLIVVIFVCCWFRISLVLEDGRTLFTSNLFGPGESTASASNETGSEAGNDTTIDDNNSASEDSESSDDNEQNESLVGDNGEGEASTGSIEPEDVLQNSGGLLPNPWVWIILGCLFSVTVVLGAIYISTKKSTEE